MSTTPTAAAEKQTPSHPLHISLAKHISLSALYLLSFISSRLFGLSVPELANQEIILEEAESNKGVVLALYEALSSRDVDTVHRLVAHDLEWWFHGPPSLQFLMRLLTGASSDADSDDSFVFVPQSFAAFGSVVLAEGCDHRRSISWVHAWTVTDGIITQVREYLNTSVTVTRVGNSGQSSSSDIASSSSSLISSASSGHHCQSVWESSLSNLVGKSVPGLVLAL
ncbi:hypothetical protein Ancab_006033 [Ancistrocladus abbreviatus]